MKNKKNIYILLPIVLLIWGAVMYQFFSFSNTGNETLTASNKFNLKPIAIKERDTFTINVNYRDPFLGKAYGVKNKSNDTTSRKKIIRKVKEPIVEPVFVWPKIVYRGIVSDTKDKTKVFMLIIDGQTFLMKIGNTEKEVFLKEGDRESVYIKYKGRLNLILIEE
jgi:hypothetical protein